MTLTTIIMGVSQCPWVQCSFSWYANTAALLLFTEQIYLTCFLILNSHSKAIARERV